MSKEQEIGLVFYLYKNYTNGGLGAGEGEEEWREE